MRTFIAADVPENVRMKVEEYCATLQDMFDSSVKWVTPENLHFTLKFLGEIPESDLRSVIECASNAADEFPPFSLSLSGIGFFPDEMRARVIWIGAEEGSDTLLEVYQHLEGCYESVGYDRDDKPFSPHLTIGRVKKNRSITVPRTFPDFDTLTFPVEGISVFKSTLTPEGPIYEKLAECSFSRRLVASGD